MMRELFRIVALALAAAASGCALEPAGPPTVPTSAHSFERRILLMLPSRRAPHLGPWDDFGPQYASRQERARALEAASAIAVEYRIRLVDEWPMPDLGVHCVVAQLEVDEDPEQMIAALNGDPRVAWAQPLQRFHVLKQQTNAGDVDASGVGWGNLAALHQVVTGRKVTIAEIDSGVDVAHPDLRDAALAAQDFVADGGGAELHGTAVAGVIVARSDPAVGLVGVAPGARLLPLRACWEITRDGAVCSSFTLAKALQYALRHDVRVINLSLTGPHDLLLARLIDRAVAHGIVVVAAAQDEAADPGFPASQAEVIAVLARPPPVATRKELLAPGVEVLTTTPQATFGFMSGSSFAAAHVSGLAALLLEASPRSTPAQVNALLERTGSAVAASAGVALVHPCAALMAFISEGALPRCGTQQAADLEASRDGIDTH